MLLLNRRVKRSVRDVVAAVLSSASSFTPDIDPVHVYGEAELRNPSFLPEIPYIYVLDSAVRQAELRLPFIALLVDYLGVPHEIGNRDFLHVYSLRASFVCRTRGECQDLAELIGRSIHAFSIWDYGAPNTEIALASVNPSIQISPAYGTDNDVIVGTFVNVCNLQMSFEVGPIND